MHYIMHAWKLVQRKPRSICKQLLPEQHAPEIQKFRSARIQKEIMFMDSAASN
jgi:hypothetical protein